MARIECNYNILMLLIDPDSDPFDRETNTYTVDEKIIDDFITKNREGKGMLVALLNVESSTGLAGSAFFYTINPITGALMFSSGPSTVSVVGESSGDEGGGEPA